MEWGSSGPPQRSSTEAWGGCQHCMAAGGKGLRSCVLWDHSRPWSHCVVFTLLCSLGRAAPGVVASECWAPAWEPQDMSRPLDSTISMQRGTVCALSSVANGSFPAYHPMLDSRRGQERKLLGSPGEGQCQDAVVGERPSLPLRLEMIFLL